MATAPPTPPPRADFDGRLHGRAREIVLGAERKIMLSESDRRRTAYHEAGHAIVGMLTLGADPVRKVASHHSELRPAGSPL